MARQVRGDVHDAALDVAVLLESASMSLHHASALYRVQHAHLHFLAQEYRQQLSPRLPVPNPDCT